jgi:uncharacterized protein (DUF1501 family)
MTTRASRRQFLKTCSALSIAGAASPFALNLAAISKAAAATPVGFRAIVCLFFYGGNDHTNTFIPYDTTSWGEYNTARQALAIPQAQLTATATGPVASQGGREFAFHPALTAFKTHWDAGKLAVVANVGPLVVPIANRTQYNSSSFQKPPKLFSHNDQQSVWQSYRPIGEGSRIGWGGRIGDLLMSQNSSPNNTLFTCISVGGNSVFLSSDGGVIQYRVGTNGPASISSISGTIYGSTGTTASTAYRSLITGTSPNLLENELGVITDRSINANQLMSTALQGAPALNPAVPANNSLASQLALVARTISVADVLGTNRQVFLVSLGGFDNHDFLLNDHAARLIQVNNAVAAFYQWLVQLGVQDQVTLFTASDFGRTLTSNGDGSDHGWGAHHFVLGGAVQGGNVYGTFPPTTFNSAGNQLDIGQGNLIPQVSVDQYAATFAHWLGVSDPNLQVVVPNIVNFSPSYLPFLL